MDAVISLGPWSDVEQIRNGKIVVITSDRNIAWTITEAQGCYDIEGCWAAGTFVDNPDVGFYFNGVGYSFKDTTEYSVCDLNELLKFGDLMYEEIRAKKSINEIRRYNRKYGVTLRRPVRAVAKRPAL